jgi:hypothetical protein
MKRRRENDEDVAHPFLQLEARDLASCLRVSQSIRELTRSDALWLPFCASLWPCIEADALSHEPERV